MVRPAAGFFGGTAQLRQGDHRHIQLLGHDLEVSGDVTDLLHPVFDPPAAAHQLEVVDDHHAYIGTGRVLVDVEDLGLHLGNGDGGGVVHINRCLEHDVGSGGQIVPLLAGELSGAEGHAADAALRRQNTAGKLLFTHFQGEDGHGDLLLFGHIGGDVQGETGFAHTGTGGQDNQVRPAQAGKLCVQIGKTGGNAHVFFPVLAGQILQGIVDVQNGTADVAQLAGIPAAAQLVQLLFGTFQSQVGVGALLGLADQRLAHLDQLPHAVLLLDDAGILLHVGDGRHRFGQLGQIDLGLLGAGKNARVIHRVQHGDHVDGQTGGEKPGHLGVDAGVVVGIEHLGPQAAGELTEQPRLQQHRPQHRLLGLHVVGLGHLQPHGGQIVLVLFCFFIWICHSVSPSLPAGLQSPFAEKQPGPPAAKTAGGQTGWLVLM